uniref:Uncharacterized protein n=1 Tax=Anguilla anguilla TaxID=7936 RepID=A0A0E9S4G0_ANGAN
MQTLQAEECFHIHDCVIIFKVPLRCILKP